MAKIWNNKWRIKQQMIQSMSSKYTYNLIIKQWKGNLYVEAKGFLNNKITLFKCKEIWSSVNEGPEGWTICYDNLFNK